MSKKLISILKPDSTPTFSTRINVSYSIILIVFNRNCIAISHHSVQLYQIIILSDVTNDGFIINFLMFRNFMCRRVSAVSPQKNTSFSRCRLCQETLSFLRMITLRSSHIVPIYTNIVPIYTNIVPIYTNIVPIYTNIVPIYTNIVPIYTNIVPITATAATIYSFHCTCVGITTRDPAQ